MGETPSKIMIEAKGITKYFGPFVAVNDLSFSIPQGQIVAFLGPNGAGKSTTMRILSGFLAPSAGTAEIAGFNVIDDRLEAAKRLGYLPENGPLYNDMTPIGLLKFFGEARCIDPDKLRERLDVVIEQCAIRDVLEKPIGKLSRGYRQRVGLAQALLHDPDVLVMDEPTAGLDPNQIRDFRQNIKVLGLTKTILISTHILQEVVAVSGRVLLIHEGKLIYDGSPDELKQDGSLEEPFYRMTNYGNPSGSIAGRVGENDREQD
ncbi:MAG: ABC transporter ATP-binding protein [Candidatus Latescibacterota bacterium]|nr:MAG: ABC transporter ATP-binding protein [Candidatus Latescibacterota bacterium]